MFEFQAPHVFDGNREPRKADNLLVSYTSSFLAKAKPNLKPWDLNHLLNAELQEKSMKYQVRASRL